LWQLRESGYDMRLVLIALLLGASTRPVATAQLLQHMLIFEPIDEVLNVTELFHVDGPEESALHFYVPESGMASVQASVKARSGATARLPLQKTAEPGVFKLTYPAQRGVTIFEVRYGLPIADRFSGRTFGTAPVRLASNGHVTLSGNSVRFLSREPRSQANVYELVNVSDGEPFEVSIATTSEAPPDRQPKRGPARVFERVAILLALTCAVLIVGGTRMYRRSA
jgi:hypothetical protein